MSCDPVVDEMRAVHDAVAREYGHDVKKLADARREQQAKSGRKAVRQSSRKVRSEKEVS